MKETAQIAVSPVKSLFPDKAEIFQDHGTLRCESALWRLFFPEGIPRMMIRFMPALCISVSKCVYRSGFSFSFPGGFGFKRK